MKQVLTRIALVVMLASAGAAFARQRNQEACAKECDDMSKECEKACKDQIKKTGKGDPHSCGTGCKDVSKSCTKMCSKERKK